MFEGQLEDVAPADAAQVDLFRGPICGSTQAQHLQKGAVKGPSGRHPPGHTHRSQLETPPQNRHAHTSTQGSNPMPGVVAHVFIPSTRKAEARGFQ